MIKKLKDFEEEIYKCSRCGLCQSVCPVYKATLNECSVSKAKFTMLNGVLKGDLELNKKIKEYTDLCTGCNACKDFCPSNIDAREIFTAVKNEFYMNNPPCLFEKFADSYGIFKSLLKFARFSFAVYRALKLKYLVKLLKPLLPLEILLADSLIENNVKIERPINTGKAKAVFFEGCFNTYLNPSSKNSLIKIFNQLKIKLDFKKFECCGVSYLNSGKIDEFLKLASKNLETADGDYDYILTDCASCNYVLKEYKKYLPCEKSEQLCKKTTNVLQFLRNKKIKAVNPVKITIHKPCHEDFDIEEIIKNIENAEYIQAEDFDKCCGFSGKFALNYPNISRKIALNKAEKFIRTNADYILTTCPACLLGINQGLIQAEKQQGDKSIKALSLLEFIAKNCTIDPQ